MKTRVLFVCLVPMLFISPIFGQVSQKSLPFKHNLSIDNPSRMASENHRLKYPDYDPNSGFLSSYSLDNSGNSMLFIFNETKKYIGKYSKELIMQNKLSVNGSKQYIISNNGGFFDYNTVIKYGDGVIFSGDKLHRKSFSPSSIWSGKVKHVGSDVFIEKINRLVPISLNAEKPSLAMGKHALTFVCYPPKSGRGTLYLLDLK